MITFLKGWKGAIEIDGTTYKNYSAIPSTLKLRSNSIIVLHCNEERSSVEEAKASTGVFSIDVKQYMTKQATPDFDFMAKWNNNNPMPLRTMVGTVIQETKGMVKMRLHGDILAERMQVCMKCGRAITNPVSQYFGLGPECGGHNYVNPFDSDEALQAAVSNYKKQLQNITWEGWIIRSAITRMEEV